MKAAKFLLIIAVATMILSALSAGFTYYSVESLRDMLVTGRVSDSGTVNLTVLTSASINFTTDVINFSTGRVNMGSLGATLDTASGTVTNGNWTANPNGFVIENIGNINVTINVKTGKINATFLGGTNPVYQYNVTNIEANACDNSSTSVALGYNNEVNITDPGTRVCSVFQSWEEADTIRIHLKLYVPSDSHTGSLEDTFTATAEPA